MVNARLHLICGNCGSNDFWKHSVESGFDGENNYTHIEHLCGNCSTIHFIDAECKAEPVNQKNLQTIEAIKKFRRNSDGRASLGKHEQHLIEYLESVFREDLNK